MIIATAGHVDHGKTSLVKALTGTDTDRHPEEKKRGLTIDIGFAYFQTEPGTAGVSQSVAIIDVPGHEKFVRNMISGVGLVDIALLVIAADDGPMPQTIEHIAILKLMSVKLIVPVISKVDLVDSARRAEVIREVSGLLAESGIATTDLHCMSVLDTTAVGNLKSELSRLIESLPARPVHRHFRMAIDRCFVVDGSGTVVTGTVSSGRLEKNDTLTLISERSKDKSARVRGLHAQNAESLDASAGQRCAINLSGELTRQELHRGTWLVANPLSVRTRIVDVSLTAAFTPQADISGAKNYKVNHWTPAHLHIGTADIPCRVALLDTTELLPGGVALARLICEKTFTAASGDRFVLRDQSARSTIAGGRVIDVSPPRRGRAKETRLQVLSALNTESPSEALNNLLGINQFGLELDNFALQFNLLQPEVDELIDSNKLTLVSSALGRWCVTQSQGEKINELIAATLLEQHADRPDQLGIGLPDLYLAMRRKVRVEVLEYHLKGLIKQERVVRIASVFRHTDHQVAMREADEKAFRKVEQELHCAGLTPLRVVELAELLDKNNEETRRFMNSCVAHGKVFRVTDNRYFLPHTIRELATIAESLSAENKLTVAEFRNKSGVGRNLVVELLEYFDRCRFTRRAGNERIVLASVAEIF